MWEGAVVYVCRVLVGESRLLDEKMRVCCGAVRCWGNRTVT